MSTDQTEWAEVNPLHPPHLDHFIVLVADCRFGRPIHNGEKRLICGGLAFTYYHDRASMKLKHALRGIYERLLCTTLNTQQIVSHILLGIQL